MELSILMKMAESNKEAAWSSYNQKFGTTAVWFDDSLYYAQRNDGYRVNSHSNIIHIENYEYLTKFLRNFGHLINDFTILRKEGSKFHWNDLLNLIASRCTSLKKLHLNNDIEDDFIELMLQSSSRVQEMSRNAMRIATVLPTLESLIVEKVYFEVGMKLDVCFPNLTSLDLMTISASKPTMFEVNFPKLEHLGITLTGEEENDEPDDYNCQLNRINIENMIKLNPQVTSIWLETEMDVSFLKFINETLPNLKKVDFLFGSHDFNDYHGNDVVFKSVTKASLGALRVQKIPLIFENLKELIASVLDNPITVDYIKKYRHLTNLNLTCDYTDKQMIQLVEVLPKVQELQLVIEKKKWPTKGMIRLLAMCQRIKNVNIMVNLNSSKQSNWRSEISSNWKIQNEFSDDFYVIEKSESTD